MAKQNQQQRAKSKLRQQLDQRTQYAHKLTAKPIPVVLESTRRDNVEPLTVYYAPVGAAVQDLYLGDLMADKMAGFRRCFFYRALDEDGRRLFAGQADEKYCMEDPDGAMYREFSKVVADFDGLTESEPQGITQAGVDAAKEQ